MLNFAIKKNSYRNMEVPIVIVLFITVLKSSQVIIRAIMPQCQKLLLHHN